MYEVRPCNCRRVGSAVVGHDENIVEAECEDREGGVKRGRLQAQEGGTVGEMEGMGTG